MTATFANYAEDFLLSACIEIVIKHAKFRIEIWVPTQHVDFDDVGESLFK